MMVFLCHSLYLYFTVVCCGDMALHHQSTWWSQNKPTLFSCLYYKSSELGRLGTFLVLVWLVSWADQALPDCIWNSCCLVNVRTVHSGKYWNGMVALKMSELPHMDCSQDGNLLMTTVNHLETLWTVVPNEALWALLDCSWLCPVSPFD